jgi:hypothetical protein
MLWRVRRLAGSRSHVCAHRWADRGTHRTARRSDRSAGRWPHMPAADGLADRRAHRPARRLADRPARRRAHFFADVWALRRRRESGFNRPGDSQHAHRRHDQRRAQPNDLFRHSAPHSNGPLPPAQRRPFDVAQDRSRVRGRVRRQDLLVPTISCSAGIGQQVAVQRSSVIVPRLAGA